MKATIKESKSWQKIINVEIPQEEVDEEFQNKLNKYKREVKLPGFRKGKVPVNLLKSRFGQLIREEAIEESVNKSYKDVLKNNNIIPIAEGKISNLQKDGGKPITFSVEIEVDPEIKINGYKKLKIKAIPNKIKQDDVDKSLMELRERMAEINDVDRVSKTGDIITIDYLSAVVDGEPRDDFKSRSQPIEIGKGTLKDFDKGLIGLSAGDEADISVKFPKDYHVKDIAGKNSELKIKVIKVQEKIIPEINEEFCKKIGDFANEKALREHISKSLEAQESELARIRAHNKAIDTLIENNDFDVPPSRIEYYIDSVMKEEAEYYPAGKVPDREEISKRYRENGIRAIKQYRIVEYIAIKEKIKATQDEVDNRIRIIADKYNQPFDQVKAALRKNGTTMKIREEIREMKTLDSLIGELPWENG